MSAPDLCGVGSLFFGVTVPAAVLLLVLRTRRAVGSSLTPLETAKAAVVMLTSEEMQEFRRWLGPAEAPQSPPTHPSEGIFRGPSGVTS